MSGTNIQEIAEQIEQLPYDTVGTRSAATEFIAGLGLNSEAKSDLIRELYTGSTQENLSYLDNVITAAAEEDATQARQDQALYFLMRDIATSDEMRTENAAALTQSSEMAETALESTTSEPVESDIDQEIAAMRQLEQDLRDTAIRNIEFFAGNPQISDNLIEQGVFTAETKDEFLNNLDNLSHEDLMGAVDDLKIAYGNLDQGNFEPLTSDQLDEIDALKEQIVETIQSEPDLMAYACEATGVEEPTAQDIGGLLAGMDAEMLQFTLQELQQYEAPAVAASADMTEQQSIPEQPEVLATTGELPPVDVTLSNDPLAVTDVPDYSRDARVTVQPGDTLSEIVNCYFTYTGLELDTESIRKLTEIIADANNIENVHDIKAGQDIIIPSEEKIIAAYGGHEINTEQWYTPDQINTEDCECEAPAVVAAFDPSMR